MVEAEALAARQGWERQIEKGIMLEEEEQAHQDHLYHEALHGIIADDIAAHDLQEGREMHILEILC